MTATRRVIKEIGGLLWLIISYIVPKSRRMAVISTYPDFDDTVRSLVPELERAGIRVVILLHGHSRGRCPPWLSKTATVLPRYSLAAIWLYHRSATVFFTHGIFAFWKTGPKQTVVNLWHGMPLKVFNDLRPGASKARVHFSITIAHPAPFKPIIARAFSVPEEKVLIARHPRLDQMLTPEPFNLSLVSEKQRLCLWLPTYRRSSVGRGYSDGDERADPYHPTADLWDLDRVFGERGLICLVKPHPMAEANGPVLEKYKNIIHIEEEVLRGGGITLYQLLGRCDYIITDFSSVYFDFIETGRNALLYCPDFDAYAANRGVVPEAYELVRHKILRSQEELVREVSAAVPPPYKPIIYDDGRNPITRKLLRELRLLS